MRIIAIDAGGTKARFALYDPVFDTSSVIKTQKPFVYKGF